MCLCMYMHVYMLQRANEEYQISVRTDLMNSYDKLKAINVKPFIQRPMSDMPSTSNGEKIIIIHVIYYVCSVF